MPGCVPGRTPPVRDIRSRTRKQPQVRARGRPGGDHRHRDIGQLSFVDDKLGSAKKRTDSRTQQDRTQDAVQQQEYLIRLFAQEIPLLRLVFIRYGLQNEASQYQHPHPVGSAETGRIE